MIKATPSTISDIEEAIKLSRDEVYCSEQLDPTEISKHPWCISLKDTDGNLGAILGLDIIRPGVAEGWAVTTTYLVIHPVAYTRKIIYIINEVFPNFNLHRLHIFVKCDSFLVEWAKTLGFTLEGKLVAYGKDRSDYYIMGRVR